MRTLAEWQALTGDDALTEAELRLIECCRTGQECVQGDGTRPDGLDPDRNIRASLLRWLILGGGPDGRTHDWGVRLAGAFVTGQLDLSFACARGITSLANCRFAESVVVLQTRFELLNLAGAALPGLNAQGATVASDIFLRNGFEATGEVNLSGAKLGGQLDCSKGRLINEKGVALNAQGATVAGDVFLCDGFAATGEVYLASAEIGGQLDCSKGRFINEKGFALNAQSATVAGDVYLRDGFEATGEVRLSGAEIGGQLDCDNGRFDNEKGITFNAQRLRVTAQFFWRKVTVDSGNVSLASAHVGDLADDPDSWPAGGRLYLDGFTYDRINGAFTDAPRRLDWLAKGDRWKGEFFPQPYTQLAKVLREMGHDRDARRVLMAQERLIRRHIRETARIVPNGDIGVGLKSVWVDLWNLQRWVWDMILRVLTGYGHAPARSLFALGLLFLIATFLANRTWEEGSFAPISGVLLVSEGWQKFADDPAVANPAKDWSADREPGQDWESFNSYAYGFDLVVPILTLGQTEAWAPSTTRGPWGRTLWWARWVLSSLGWFLTALGAAAITGIIRRE